MTQASPPPKTRLLAWIAAGLLILMPLSGLGVRTQLLAVKGGLLLFAIAVVASVILALVCLVGLFARPSGPAKRSLLITLLLCLPAILLVLLALRNSSAPFIHQVSTDIHNPPAFVVAIERRGDSSNPLDYTMETAELQLEAYPDLKPIATPLSPGEAFQRALAIAGQLGWEVYATAPAEGRIEAVDTTFWFGFKDDIAIRIAPAADSGSVVDLRSISRVGEGDTGTNARRIRQFRSLFND